MNNILNDGNWKENYKFLSPASLFLASFAALRNSTIKSSFHVL